MGVEAYMKNILSGDKTSNYEIMAEEARKRFLSMDMDEISVRTGNILEGETFRICFLGREYTVSTKSGIVTGTDGSPVDYGVSMILYDLLGYAKQGAIPSGNYTQVQNLAQVVSTAKYAGQGMFDKRMQQMDGKDLQLRAVCEKLGGIPWGRGDVSCLIPLYRDLKFGFSFWDSDDEFAASASVLFDSNSLQYMHYETLWYCLSHIFSRIEEEMAEADKNG